jgi:type VI secretion system protein ImpK
MTAVRADNLALIYQEVITVIVRLRAGRLRFDGIEIFRGQMRAAIEKAEKEGLLRGYTLEDVRVTTFAIVAFLDESILNSRNPIFANWQAKPLQEELFGVHEAGEIFFRNVERLLGRADAEPLADLLEVHQLVLLLGLRGRYSAAGTAAEIRMLLDKIEEKIRRIRGSPVMPAWQPPPQIIAKSVDPWIPVMKWVAIGCAGVALVLFVIFKFSLSSTVTALGNLASKIFS